MKLQDHTVKELQEELSRRNWKSFSSFERWWHMYSGDSIVTPHFTDCRAAWDARQKEIDELNKLIVSLRNEMIQCASKGESVVEFEAKQLCRCKGE